jgi:hypothetical protein
MYVKVTGPGMPAERQEDELAETFWLEQDIVARQMKLLEASEITRAGEEAVDVVDSYILVTSRAIEEVSWQIHVCPH